MGLDIYEIKYKHIAKIDNYLGNLLYDYYNDDNSTYCLFAKDKKSIYYILKASDFIDKNLIFLFFKNYINNSVKIIKASEYNILRRQ